MNTQHEWINQKHQDIADKLIADGMDPKKASREALSIMKISATITKRRHKYGDPYHNSEQ